MNIILKTLELKNFKGVKEAIINFGKETTIYGDNATGKTTMVDAFLWGLFGKDSEDRKDYNIKTIDSEGNVLRGLEHTVTIVLDIDGQLITLTRLYKEKWTKTKGQALALLTGHTTDYYINEVPSKAKDYQEKINDIFEESKFKLLTSPLYFNNMKWQEQRKLLLEIVGNIADKDIIKFNPKLKPLETLVVDGIDNFMAINKAKISKLNLDKKGLPYRIDEANNSIVEVDNESIKLTISAEEKNLLKIEAEILDKNKSNDYKLDLQKQLYTLKEELQNKTMRANSIASNPKKVIQDELYSLGYKIENNNNLIGLREKNIVSSAKNILEFEKIIADKTFENDKLKVNFSEIVNSTMTINKNDSICPSCLRELQEEKIIEVNKRNVENFAKDNSNKKQAINKVGKSNKILIEESTISIDRIKLNSLAIQEEIERLKSENNKTQLEIKIKELQLSKISENPIIIFEGKEQLELEIKALEDDLSKVSLIDNSTLLIEKKRLESRIIDLKASLGQEVNNIKLLARIEVLKLEESELNIKIADLEGLQFLGEEFIRTKVDMLEGSINKKFKGEVSFKLFDNQINGGLNETCMAMVDGKHYSALNSAAKINAGLSIINVISEHFGVTGPIFIDNAESTNKYVKTNSQIVKLKVADVNGNPKLKEYFEGKFVKVNNLYIGGK